MRMRLRITTVVLAALFALPATLALAQEDFSGNSYITPYPEGDTYRLQAYGDVYADGLLGRLIEAMADDTRVQIQKKHRSLPGLIRPDLDDELKAEEANKEPLHIALVMIGAYDRFNMRGSGTQRFILGTDEWRQEYGRRADRLMKTLKKRGAAVYWVGQPIMRQPNVNEQAQTMNDIVREKAYLNGVKYIDITAQFADEAGNFALYGPDIAGKQMLMRDGDGVLFSWAGYRKLAYFVEREIRRDLTVARNDRSIPLAGSDVGAETHRRAATAPAAGYLLAGYRLDQQGLAGSAPRQDRPWGSPADAGCDRRCPGRTQGRQRPHLAQDRDAGRSRGGCYDRAASAGHSLRGDPAHHAQGYGRAAIADGRCARRRCRRRTGGAQLRHGRGDRPRRSAQSVAGSALLSGVDQGRAPAAPTGTRRRFLLAAA